MFDISGSFYPDIMQELHEILQILLTGNGNFFGKVKMRDAALELSFEAKVETVALWIFVAATIMSLYVSPRGALSSDKVKSNGIID